MSKNLWFKLSIALTVLAVAVFWLLSVTKVAFEGFSLTWAGAIITGVCAVLFILRGLFVKTVGPVKKLYIFGGAALAIVCILCFVNIFAIKSEWVFPIIAVVLAAALVISIIAVGGKKWDTGDNQKVGYKNYYQRKAEEEERIRKEQDKNN